MAVSSSSFISLYDIQTRWWHMALDRNKLIRHSQCKCVADYWQIVHRNIVLGLDIVTVSKVSSGYHSSTTMALLTSLSILRSFYTTILLAIMWDLAYALYCILWAPSWSQKGWCSLDSHLAPNDLRRTLICDGSENWYEKWDHKG